MVWIIKFELVSFDIYIFERARGRVKMVIKGFWWAKSVAQKFEMIK